MADPYKSANNIPTYPPRNGVAIDVSAVDQVLDPPSKKIYVGGTGDLAVQLADAPGVLVFKALPVGTMLEIQASKIYKTGTTATLCLALFG